MPEDIQIEDANLPVDEMEPALEEPAREESAPMLDVHPPHHAISSWREFFIHIATISIGLLIAVGLEQGVEVVHRRNERKELQRELHEETLTNREWGQFNLVCIERDLNWLLELRRRVDAVRRGGDKKMFVYPPRPDGYPGDPHHSDRRLPAVAVWSSARQTSLIDLLPPDDAQMYTVFYATSDLYAQFFTEFTKEWNKLMSFELRFEDSWAPTEPDIQRMSPQELDDYAALIDDLFINGRSVRRYLQIQITHNDDAIEHRLSPHVEEYLRTHQDSFPGPAPGLPSP